MQQQPINPGVALGVNDMFGPVPTRWRTGKIQAVTPDGPGTFVVVMFDTPQGTNAFVLPADVAQQLAHQILTDATGLTIAGPNGNGTPKVGS